MKILSIILTSVMVFPILYFLLHIMQYYDAKGAFMLFSIDGKWIFQIALPSMIFLTIYLIGFSIAIFLNIKKKYVMNSIFTGVMMIVYAIIPLIIRF